MIHRRDRAARWGDVARLSTRDAATALMTWGVGATVAIGHDLVYIPEFRTKLRPRFLERVFTSQEIAEGEGTFDPATFFGARWAAKEAAYKAFCELTSALALPQDGLATFRQYEVSHRAGIAVPALVLRDRARQVVEDLGRDADVNVTLSLTDERDYAAAFVVIARVPRPADRRIAS